jgi:hypothetical protein
MHRLPTQLTLVVLTIIGVVLLYFGTDLNAPWLIVLSVTVLLIGFAFMIIRSRSGIGND